MIMHLSDRQLIRSVAGTNYQTIFRFSFEGRSVVRGTVASRLARKK